MNELENIVKSVVYGGIGAAATLVEKGGDLARTLVEKGQETMRANQDVTDDIKRRVREFCDKFMNEDTIDVSTLTPGQRAELRRQLDELDAAEAASATPDGDAPATGPSDDDVPVCQSQEPAAPEDE